MAEPVRISVDRLPDEKVSSVPVRVYDKNGQIEERPQWVVKEQPVTLYLNEREVVTLLCAGHHLDELAVGFFYGEGFLEAPEDLEKVDIDNDSGKVMVSIRNESILADRLWMKRTITSGCGKGSVFYYALDALMSRPSESSLRITPAQVWERVEELSRLSETYRRTHGVHNTALAAPEEVLVFRDDIGRHNAVDMIVGHAFLNNLSLDDKMLITTGRLTSEILIKAAKVGIPVLASRNTATTLAIELAKSLNITLIGYARAGKFTVYSGEERIQDA
jgi:FdhD protein